MESFIKFSTLKTRLLKNPEARKAYDELGPEFELIEALIEKRLQRKLTQAALARKMRTKQSSVARLESPGYNPSLAFLRKAAKALDTRLVVFFADHPVADSAARRGKQPHQP